MPDSEIAAQHDKRESIAIADSAGKLLEKLRAKKFWEVLGQSKNSIVSGQIVSGQSKNSGRILTSVEFLL